MDNHLNAWLTTPLDEISKVGCVCSIRAHGLEAAMRR
jgi:hypothetical protein